MRTGILIGLIVILALVKSDQIPGCSGNINNQTIVTQQPKLVGQVPNGKKFITPYDGRNFYTLVVNGSAYDMGLAQG